MNRGNSHYHRSIELLREAGKLIPTGTQTFSKSALQFPVGRAPHFLERGQGGRVWDIDGNEYVDLVAGLLAVMLGYRDPDVDAAIKQQLERGISFSLALELEYELARRLVELVPCAEMVRFGKNGSDATTAAVRIARAVTGRDHVITCGYHGWHDWSIGSTVRNKGVPKAVQALTHPIPYNDIETLEQVLSGHKGEIAALIMEPVHASEPASGFLDDVKQLVHQYGSLLIFDEIITGFRFAPGGAQALFGVTPDLACFGKALGNGMPISAVVGSRDLMQEYEEVFVSGTFGGEALSLAAAIAVIDKIKSIPVIETLWQTGKDLGKSVQQTITAHGLEEIINISGFPPMQSLTFFDHPNASADEIKTLFVCLMLEHGVMTIGSHNMMYAHTSGDMDYVLKAYDAVLDHIDIELKQPGLSQRLGCELIRPVFSVRGN